MLVKLIFNAILYFNIVAFSVTIGYAMSGRRTVGEKGLAVAELQQKHLDSYTSSAVTGESAYLREASTKLAAISGRASSPGNLSIGFVGINEDIQVAQGALSSGKAEHASLVRLTEATLVLNQAHESLAEDLGWLVKFLMSLSLQVVSYFAYFRWRFAPFTAREAFAFPGLNRLGWARS